MSGTNWLFILLLNSYAESTRGQEEKKVEKEAAGKLLDDLFRKTSALPVLYWLPLNEEEAEKRVKVREEKEKKRRQEYEAREERLREMRERRNQSPRGARKVSCMLMADMCV